MDLTPEQEYALFKAPRNGLIQNTKRWPNNRVIYEIDEDRSTDELADIERAMKVIESSSCIEFKERTNEIGYIEFSVSILQIFIQSQIYRRKYIKPFIF